jgi:hypothetical protein
MLKDFNKKAARGRYLPFILPVYRSSLFKSIRYNRFFREDALPTGLLLVLPGNI